MKDWLVDALAATLVQKGIGLTEDALTRTMPHPAKRLSLEMEARAGEHTIALHESESAKQFQALWKKPAKAENAKSAPAQEAAPNSATLPMPQVAPKPTQPRVGQRAPERDLVGETNVLSTHKASRCSFIDGGDTCSNGKSRSFALRVSEEEMLGEQQFTYLVMPYRKEGTLAT